MKNIFENWNKYLTEFWYSDVQLEDGGAEYALAVIPKKKIKIKLCEQGTMMYGGEISEGEGPEDKFFQKAISIGNQIKQIHNQFIDQITQKGTKEISVEKDLKKYIVFFTDDVETKTGIKLIGCGAFRCVFDIDNDYVIKFDITPKGTAKSQNETDAKFGRFNYGNLFPKSYIADKDHSWVVLEKAKPFTDANMSKFVSYFPNKKVKFNNNLIHYKMITFSFMYYSGYFWKQMAIKEFEQFKNQYLSPPNSEDEKKKRLKNPLFAEIESEMKNLPELATIAEGFQQNNPFDLIVRFIEELKIRPDEIRLGNTGMGANKRFVIIDSSLEKQIMSGFGQTQDSPVTPVKPPKPANVPAGETIKIDR